MAATVLVAIVVVACEAEAPRFEGGALRNIGAPFYPRFIATFEPLPLDQPGEFSFPFRRFPSARAGVVLETPSRPAVQALEVLTTRVELSVTDQASPGTAVLSCFDGAALPSHRPYRADLDRNCRSGR
jgi:hypothetical protein